MRKKQSRCYVKSEGVLFNREKDNTIQVLDLSTNKMFSIDGLASDVWLNINGKNTIDDIVKKLHKRNSISEKFLTKNINKFLSKLEGMNIVKITNE